MEEQLITYKTAKLAKEKGFDVPTNTLYQHNGDIHEVLPSDTYPHLAHYRDKLDVYTTGYYNWNSLNLDEENPLHKISGFSESDEDRFTVKCSAPTQSLLQKWLREEYDIFIYCSPIGSINNNEQDIKWRNNISIRENNYYTTYEEALEKGLQEGLKLIKK